MANTKIPVELSSTPSISDSGNATALTIDSDENIGFNTTGIAAGSTSSSQNSTATPKKIVINNDYSSGYTDASLKLYLFNSVTTRQGFTSGPAYDLQYHSSGHATGRHAFYVGNTEEVRIDADGIKFNGDSAAVNALDDYEEGTFTPTISAGGVTYAYQVGWYTKIGNLVNVGIHLDVDVNSNASGTAVAITLPFTSSYSNAQAYSMTSAVWCNGWASAPKADIGLLGHNASIVTFYYNNGTSLAASTQGQLGGGNMLFNIQYTAA